MVPVATAVRPGWILQAEEVSASEEQAMTNREDSESGWARDGTDLSNTLCRNYVDWACGAMECLATILINFLPYGLDCRSEGGRLMGYQQFDCSRVNSLWETAESGIV
jgi:hypothetical protein